MDKVAIIGLGKSGLSACRYLGQKGCSIWITDDHVTRSGSDGNIHHVAPSVVSQMIEKKQFSFLLISPGIPLSHPLVKQAKKYDLEVFCDIEYAFRELENRHIPISGITGTNGKTTTTSLVAFIMNYARRAARAVGNIGVPFLDEIGQEDDIHYVLELSSFQLQTVHTPLLQAAALLNISPNHLDHHSNLEEYIQAKQQIGAIVNDNGVLFVQEKAFRVHKWNHVKCQILRFGFTSACEIFGDGQYVYRFGVREERLPESLQGEFSHDAENFLAAYSICRHFDISPKQCVEAYSSFCKPPHRMQLVRTCHGVSFYDDSKATNIEAVIKAVESLQSNVVLIAGGVHKGYPYHSWKSVFEGRVKKVFLIGQAASFIEEDLSGTISTHRCMTFEDAVKSAAELAKTGDKVILSPGCSSFDMFSCFEDRGRKFQELVNQL